MSNNINNTYTNIRRLSGSSLVNALSGHSARSTMPISFGGSGYATCNQGKNGGYLPLGFTYSCPRVPCQKPSYNRF